MLVPEARLIRYTHVSNTLDLPLDCAPTTTHCGRSTESPPIAENVSWSLLTTEMRSTSILAKAVFFCESFQSLTPLYCTLSALVYLSSRGVLYFQQEGFEAVWAGAREMSAGGGGGPGGPRPPLNFGKNIWPPLVLHWVLVAPGLNDSGPP